MQPQTFVFFGQVGSGKGTQVKILMDFLKNRDKRECVYASTGDEYRKLVGSESYTGDLVRDSLTRGELQPDFLTSAIVANILMSSLTPEKNIFADGYPRTLVQSQIFEEMMRFFKRENIKIIYIELDQEEAMKRNLLRGRADDTKEGLAERFNEYVKNVVPAMNYFRDKIGYTIYTINGAQSIENVHKDIIKALGF